MVDAARGLAFQYPTRCRIVDAEALGYKLAGQYPAKTPAKSRSHIGKSGLAELITDHSVRITLDDGTILWGSDCWWVPIY